MTVQLHVNWTDGDGFAANVYTTDAGNGETPSGVEVTRTGAGVALSTSASVASLVTNGGDTASASVPSGAQLDHDGGSVLLLVDPRTMGFGNGRFLSLDSANATLRVRRDNGSGGIMVEASWNNGEAGCYEIFLTSMPTTPSWMWIRFVPSASSPGDRLEVRLWEVGDSIPGSFGASTGNGGGAAATSGNMSPLSSMGLFGAGSSETFAAGPIWISDDPDEDLGALIGGGPPPTGNRRRRAIICGAYQ